MRTISALMSFFMLLNLTAIAEETVKVGDPAPSFQLPYATAEEVNFEGLSSDDLKGTRYLLAFYPADWSGGCTKQMCTFRDGFSEFEDLNVEVFPISADLVFSHKEFAAHHKLPFKLLADHTREFGKAMGVWREDYGMFARSVFVVGPDGKFEYIDYEYSLADDSDYKALKKALAELNK